MCQVACENLHVYSAFKIQVLSTSAIKCWDNFRIFQFPLATVEDSAETFVYYVANGFGIGWHFAKGSDLVF